MKTIDNLEIHLVHSCNLACEGCSHYSNQGHQGMISLEEADAWMRQWNQRVSPRTFSLLGGEPTIHPKLVDFVSLSRRNWPEARLQLVTNGFLLHRHPDLPAVLGNDPNACISLSIHHTSPQYRERLLPVVRLLVEWTRRHSVQIDFRPSHGSWTRRYKGFGPSMEPFDDGRPRESWERCPAKYCKQLFRGELWKCAPIAYLPMQHVKYGLSAAWTPYLEYKSLASGCTDEELSAFLALEDESCCRMCPADPERFEMPLPFPARAVVRGPR